jgi:hypothetical protein
LHGFSTASPSSKHHIEITRTAIFPVAATPLP